MRSIKATRATGVKWVVSLLAALMIPGIAFADVVHFYNGKLLRGKLKRVTGDIIEFRQGDMFGSTENIPRLKMSSRHDMVETLTGHKYYGEIFYMDKFKIDLKASSGLVQINRLRVKNVVLGTPMQQPVLPNTPSGLSTQPLGMSTGNGQSVGMQEPTATPASSYANTRTIPEPAPELRGPTPEGEPEAAVPSAE